MTDYVAPHPDGVLPLLYTATCEQCRPRHAELFHTETRRDEVARLHHSGTGHPVTLGTMRGQHT